MNILSEAKGCNLRLHPALAFANSCIVASRPFFFHLKAPAFDILHFYQYLSDNGLGRFH